MVTLFTVALIIFMIGCGVAVGNIITKKIEDKKPKK